MENLNHLFGPPYITKGLSPVFSQWGVVVGDRKAEEKEAKVFLLGSLSWTVASPTAAVSPPWLQSPLDMVSSSVG